MAHLERTVVDDTEVSDRVEAAVQKHRGTATQKVVERVHRQAPEVPPAKIRAAVWDLVGRGKVSMRWDSRLYPAGGSKSLSRGKATSKGKALRTKARAARRP